MDACGHVSKGEALAIGYLNPNNVENLECLVLPILDGIVALLEKNK